MPEIRIADCLIEGEDIYFALCNFGIMYKLNLKTKEIKKIAKLPSMRQLEYAIGIKSIVEYNNQIYMFSYEDDDCYMYDKNLDKLKTYRNFTNIPHYKAAMSQAHLINDSIWIVPQTVNRDLYTYNEKHGFIRDKEWTKKIKELLIKKNDIFLFTSGVSEKEIWTAVQNKQKLLRYNIETKEMSMTDLKYNVIGLTCKDNYVWMVITDFVGFLRYDIKKDIFEEFYFCEWNEEGAPFLRILFKDKYVLLLPSDYKQLLYYDLNAEKFETIEFDSKNFSYILTENKLYILPWGKDDITLQIIDLNKMEIVDSIKLDLFYEDYYHLRYSAVKGRVQIEEQENLDDFIQYVPANSSKKKSISKNKGYDIYHIVKEE